MWSDYITVKQQDTWGAYINDIDTEAAIVEQGSTYAALLNCLTVIEVSGEEAATFLQGQLTCDINLVNERQAKLGAHCNQKGRAQTTFVCGKRNDSYFLVLPSDQETATTKELAKYALFSKAQISVNHEFLIMGLAGAESKALEHTLSGRVPGLSLISAQNLTSLALIPKTSAQACIDTLQEHKTNLVGDNGWQLGQINAGVTHITADQSEKWIPQEFNYDLIDGISFKKGCYKGQEIIARIHYRGQTKVRTYALEITGSEQVRIGDKIISEAGQGTILAVARVSERTLRALSTLKIEASESQNLKLEQNDDCQIRVLPLPYAIT